MESHKIEQGCHHDKRGMRRDAHLGPEADEEQASDESDDDDDDDDNDGDEDYFHTMAKVEADEEGQHDLNDLSDKVESDSHYPKELRDSLDGYHCRFTVLFLPHGELYGQQRLRELKSSNSSGSERCYRHTDSRDPVVGNQRLTQLSQTARLELENIQSFNRQVSSRRQLNACRSFLRDRRRDFNPRILSFSLCNAHKNSLGLMQRSRHLSIHATMNSTINTSHKQKMKPYHGIQPLVERNKRFSMSRPGHKKRLPGSYEHEGCGKESRGAFQKKGQAGSSDGNLPRPFFGHFGASLGRRLKLLNIIPLSVPEHYEHPKVLDEQVGIPYWAADTNTHNAVKIFTNQGMANVFQAVKRLEKGQAKNRLKPKDSRISRPASRLDHSGRQSSASRERQESGGRWTSFGPSNHLEFTVGLHKDKLVTILMISGSIAITKLRGPIAGDLQTKPCLSQAQRGRSTRRDSEVEPREREDSIQFVALEDSTSKERWKESAPPSGGSEQIGGLERPETSTIAFRHAGRSTYSTGVASSRPSGYLATTKALADGRPSRPLESAARLATSARVRRSDCRKDSVAEPGGSMRSDTSLRSRPSVVRRSSYSQRIPDICSVYQIRFQS